MEFKGGVSLDTLLVKRGFLPGMYTVKGVYIMDVPAQGWVVLSVGIEGGRGGCSRGGRL